jgi:hypothetical protein
MIVRRTGLNPLCRQCGHEIDGPTARCPMCGMRTGLVLPLQLPAPKSIDEPIVVTESVEEGDFEEAGDMVLAPPVERSATPLMSIESDREVEEDAEPSIEHAPVARNVSLGSLMFGTMLIAVCLGLGRASITAGVAAFLVLIPAYLRTLSAIYYYRTVRGRNRLGDYEIHRRLDRRNDRRVRSYDSRHDLGHRGGLCDGVGADPQSLAGE